LFSNKISSFSRYPRQIDLLDLPPLPEEKSVVWILIREEYLEFMDVDVKGFIYNFNCEQDCSWVNITGDIIL